MKKKILSMLLAMVMLLGLLPTKTIALEGDPQDVSTVLSATLTQLAATVTEPNFGTNAGEWTVFSLARGNHFAREDRYFTDYYSRIEAYVNETAAALDMSGALDKNKSTDNSRLIVALSAIGKDARKVGNWDLVEAYSANGMNWIRKQGINGTIWTLIALDSRNYETSVADLRQQCVDSILSLQHNDGGWSLVTAKAQPSNVDITGMTLTALYPYRDQPAVAEACEKAFGWLSESQLDNGGFPYGKGETSESCVWAIVACATWGINPDTDARFIKNDLSALDNLLTYYIAEEARFSHARGAEANAMATDQASYALVAYNRLITGETGLFDYSDVVDLPQEKPAPLSLSATLSMPGTVESGTGLGFQGSISIDNWDNSAGYKLVDLVMNLPQGVTVTEVSACQRLTGGQVSFHQEAETGKLRVVCFDPNGGDLMLTGSAFPAELFSFAFQVQGVAVGSSLNVGISGMSVKLTPDAEAAESMIVVNTENAYRAMTVAGGVSFTAKRLYVGDDVDLIPASKMAVAVTVTGLGSHRNLTYKNGEQTFDFHYSPEISAKTGGATYLALVDSAISVENFVVESNFVLSGEEVASITLGDSNGDGVINAQDALVAVDCWLRKGDAPTDRQILTMNVNGDSRLNTFDALGIVEAFVNHTDYILVTKAAEGQ